MDPEVTVSCGLLECDTALCLYLAVILRIQSVIHHHGEQQCGSARRSCVSGRERSWAQQAQESFHVLWIQSELFVSW